MTDQNPWMPGPAWNTTRQGLTYRDNPALAERMIAEAEDFKARRRDEEQDLDRLWSALARHNAHAAQAARRAWDQASK